MSGNKHGLWMQKDLHLNFRWISNILLANCIIFLSYFSYLWHRDKHIDYSRILGRSNDTNQRRQWHPTPVLLPGKSHGWRSLVGCSPWGHGELDMTERLHFHFSLLCIGEGNGNPLQCSCLENPKDEVAQSRTQLKWLSSSSSNDTNDTTCII